MAQGKPTFERKLQLNRPLSLALTFADLRQGAYDPCTQFDHGYLWWATRTERGPATICLSMSKPNELHGRAWGPGAEFLVEHLDELCGEHQNDAEFETSNQLVAQLHHELAGLRIPKMRNVWEMCFAIILAQRVTGGEAIRSYRSITFKLSEPAPGPRKMLLPVDAAQVANMPYWWFHRFGVERKRAEVIRTCAKSAARLNALVGQPHEVARRKMMSIPGLGLWTSASVALVALGDQDAVPVGDYHFANHVAWSLAKEPRGTDQRMLELLAPFNGVRGRVLRLILSGARGAPKFGPRYSPIPISSL